jgi:circadian clock protein KaiB
MAGGDVESRAGKSTNGRPEIYDLRLYVAGHTDRSVAAIENLRRICDKHVPGRYTLEVIDVLRNPELARRDQIVALPTAVRMLSDSSRRISGDFSNAEKTISVLDLRSTGG